MLSRLAIVIAAAGLIAAALSPPEAHAADAIVARDTLIQYIWPLDGDLVYRRLGKTRPKRVWMARFRGQVHQARGIPRGASSGGIGLDGKGRKVFTFSVQRYKAGHLLSSKWFIYDLARDRARPVRGLSAKCPVYWLAMWRESTVYTTRCKNPDQNAVFQRQEKRTRRLPADPWASYVFRAGTLAALWEDGLDDVAVVQYMANGKSCRKFIDAGIGDATEGLTWFPTSLRITNGSIVWTMGFWYSRPDFAILSAKVAPGCGSPGPVGRFPFTPETATVKTLAVDDRHVFYADDATLRSEVLPAEPSFDPPPNDDFEHAQELSGGASLYATGNVAYATVQPGEPLADTKHTVWFAFRPEKSGPVYVNVPGACEQAPEYCGGVHRYGVYTGTSPQTLALIPPDPDPYKTYTRVDAVAGETYWIAVGSPAPEPNYRPFVVTVTPNPPAY